MYKKTTLIITIALYTLHSCKRDVNNHEVFTIKSNDETGIHFSNDLKDTPEQNIIEYLYYYNGGGVAIGDINNDGLEDIYFTANQKSDKLYLNKGNLKFEDITSKSGIIEDNGWSTGVTMDDVNNDGYLDIYVCRVDKYCTNNNNHNLLYINQKNGTFKEMSKQMALDFKGYSTQASFLDYDKDGDLDMYLLNHNVHSVNSYGTIEKRNEKDSLSGDLFFENKLNEIGKFIDVSRQVGIYSSPLGYGLAVACGDLNNDGWTDIYVGNDFHENDYVYINNQNKTFTESINQVISHSSQFSMGADIADMNNDGWNDIFVTDMMPYKEEVAAVSGGEDTDNIKRIKQDLGFEMQYSRNHFQLNQKNGTFNDIAFYTKTFATDWSWSVLLEDFNNDMKKDIFITTGIVKRPNNLDYINYLNVIDTFKNINKEDRYKKLISKMPSEPLSNIIFTQQDNLQFSSINSSFIGKPAFSNGAAYSDLDNDGDLDIVTNNINEKAFIYENKTNLKTKYINIILKNESNRATKGAKIIAAIGDDEIYKELQTTKGFLSSSTHKIHLGLGNSNKIDSLKVIWLDGNVQTLYNVNTNQTITISYDKKQQNFWKSNQPIEDENIIQLPILHQENKYYDDNNEKLIPEKLSFDGPAIIFEDLNNDGIKDLYLGGSRNFRPKFYLGSKSGKFIEKINSDFEKDAQFEDIAAASIDFDGDGDRDIYVVSGGNDNPELSKLMEDRIYLNNGNGIFKRIPISLPHTNGSCIAVEDFDKDGFEDLFIGARSIPLYYGLSPYSFLLKNNQGRGISIVFKERIGMLTDAKWGDIDNDTKKDLIVCGDWMSIRVYKNKISNFEEITESLGLDKKKGFWNTIELTDLNKDNRIDIIAGNIGLNTKFNASDSLPIKLYVGDFDKNGSSDPIIFYHYFNEYIPFASYDKIASHLPRLKKHFRTYQSFKNVKNMEELFKDYSENIIAYKEVNELRSMVFLNINGKFNYVPLGMHEQWSDINDFEINGNNIIYTGNRKSYVSELGNSVSNSGRILSDFDTSTNTFKSSANLFLPINKSLIKVINHGDNRFLIIPNDDYLSLLQLN